MNKNFKLKLILSSLAIFLPAVICIMFEEQLSKYLPYFSVEFDKKTMGFITGFLLVLHLSAIYITYLDNKRKNQSKKMFNILFWVVPVISLFCNGISVMSFAEYDINIFVGVFFGILFIIVGNYMPKCVQNRTIGIKIKWTLANEENWNKTHRFGGRAFVVGGILICISSLLPVEIFMGVMLVTIMFWFSSFNKIITTDKFVYLFGKIIPSLSLILSMSLRLLPNFKRQMQSIAESRKAMGKDIANGNIINKFTNAVSIFSIMISWAFENSIDTADSMKSRGYGVKKRTTFSIYHFYKL